MKYHKQQQLNPLQIHNKNNHFIYLYHHSHHSCHFLHSLSWQLAFLQFVQLEKPSSWPSQLQSHSQPKKHSNPSKQQLSHSAKHWKRGKLNFSSELSEMKKRQNSLLFYCNSLSPGAFCCGKLIAKLTLIPLIIKIALPWWPHQNTITFKMNVESLLRVVGELMSMNVAFK